MKKIIAGIILMFWVFSSVSYAQDLDGGDPESEIPVLRDYSFVKLTEEECDWLLGIAMAEAQGEDAKGKALVMRVVLNRSYEWNQSLEEVIFSENQFATYRMDIEPSEDCYEALSMIVDGWDESDGALWFCAKGYPKYGEHAFQYGGHYFSKKEVKHVTQKHIFRQFIGKESQHLLYR
jgi:spore germination cell wall hydrolase CwlJ-like protein